MTTNWEFVTIFHGSFCPTRNVLRRGTRKRTGVDSSRTLLTLPTVVPRHFQLGGQSHLDTRSRDHACCIDWDIGQTPDSRKGDRGEVLGATARCKAGSDETQNRRLLSEHYHRN